VLDVTTSKYFVSSVFGPSVFFALSLPHYHPKTPLVDLSGSLSILSDWII
jgi:hypothetical protein